jgi:CRISPR-associated DxTHG motif protein
MKLLTFLGVGKYESTLYTWEGQERTACFAPAASCTFLRPDKLIVFLTQDAQEQIYPKFCQELPSGLAVEAVAIPLGGDERQLWQIFAQVSGAVQPGEEVAFDITHGLRSFPLIGLLAASFLRSGLDVRLAAVLYGAYDVGRLVSPGKTPMFDLTPMLALLEWSAAADRFNRTGDSRYLASLIQNQRKALARTAKGDRKHLEQVGALGNLAGALTDISQSLNLIRPVQSLERTAALSGYIHLARPALEWAAAAKPFDLLLEEVERAYAPLGMDQPLDSTRLRLSLEQQRRLAAWYVEREQWVQAVTLAREWLVNWFMAHLNLTDLTNRENRDRVERVVNIEAKSLIETQKAKNPFNSIFLGSVPGVEAALNVWNLLIDVRNDIDHAGFREHPRQAVDLIEQIKSIVQTLETLPLEGIPCS